ncbi:aquaporin-9-like isoform X2 [Anneissia japonica]|uniref:aquaporin-9-like isoform X2 n=1 Tax=Anneissia japonica TaxID=1529436 RepID=UPI0014256FB1|nr:aquaporin-9-like isoform X2 [Anneissia japonica]
MGLRYEKHFERFSCTNLPLLRKLLSELLGMFAFVLIASSTVASVTFNKDSSDVFTNSTYDSSEILYINVGIAFGYTIGLYTCIENVGYLNLALTVLFWCFGKMKWNDMVVYLSAQFIGAMLAEACIYGLYCDNPMTSLIFSSSGNSDPFMLAAFEQFLKTMVFTIGVMAVIDEHKDKQEDYPLNTIKPSKSFEPLMIGLVVFMVGIAFSHYARFYFNPLQDLSGLIFVAVASLRISMMWLIGQLIVPLVGCFIGALIYISVIENNHQKPVVESTREGEELKNVLDDGSTGNLPNQ